MKAFAAELNTLLVDTFHEILRVEENTVKKMRGGNLSIGEVHVLEAVGSFQEEPPTISDIATRLAISLPSVTVAINKLATKGYVEKERNPSDGREIHIYLTKEGKTINAVHTYFHEQMVRNISGEFTPGEKEVLIRAMQKLNSFFRRKT